MEIMFQPIARGNFRDVVRLKVAPEQDDFVAPNLYSIAEAFVEPTWTPLAMYAHEALVGFAMFGYDDETDRWWIIRFMIGAAHQGKGLGAAALSALVALMAERHGCRAIHLGYVPGNAIAERLYARIGFIATGEIEDGEIVARLDLPMRV
ncbi:MAG: GNAT family N-acetyltransferase [Thermomicrobiales bacterium]|nr:GNAT family N-acetyltransferase [Thermomicrobiales bacterium]